jgi:hypothetical protein
MAVTLWKAEYHHLAFLDDVMGSQSSMACSFSVFMTEVVGAIAATKSRQDFGTAASALLIDEIDPVPPGSYNIAAKVVERQRVVCWAPS